MIAQLRGMVETKHEDRVILDVNGVGYEVLLSALDLEQIQPNETLRIFTYHHIRETAQELFGFLHDGGKGLFQKLISVNGVGPKGAMAIMALGDDKQIKGAIASGNIAFLTGASGIGKKAAEKIVLDLKDKVGLISVGGSVIDSTPNKQDEAYQALVALGYSGAQANEALAHVDAGASLEERVKQALKGLSS